MSDLNKYGRLGPVSSLYWDYLALRSQKGPITISRTFDFDNNIMVSLFLNDLTLDNPPEHLSLGSTFEYSRLIKVSSNEIALNPQHSVWYFFRSLAYYFSSDYEKAYTDAATVVKLSTINDLYYLQGQAYEKNGQYQLATLCFEISNKVEKSSRNFFKIGWIESTQGDYIKAIENFDEMVKINPTDIRAYEGRSQALWAIGRKKEAIADLITCITINRGLSIAYVMLAEYNFNLNENNEEAICLLRIALIAEPNNPNFFLALANYYHSWISIKGLSNEFIEKYNIDDSLTIFCNNSAFNERLSIANGFYSSAFVGMFPKSFKTEIDKLSDNIYLSIFVGNQDHLFDILRTHTLFFADVSSFPDKASDCPIFHPNSQSQLARNISMDNVRVRCCSILNKSEDICKSLSMWDRYANGHKGVCYTLKIPKTWLLRNMIYAHGIKYSGDDIELRADSPEQLIRDGMFTKHVGYHDEREFRLIAFGKFINGSGLKLNFYGGNTEDSIKIEAVYAGTHISDENRKTMMSLVLQNYPVVAYQLKQIAAGKLASERIWR